jgi:hypothetical protein
MRSCSCFLLSTLVYFCVAASAQHSSPEWTAFEAHTHKPGSRVAYQREAGSISTTRVTMRVSAMVVDDSAMRRMKGVRIGFEGAGGDDPIYLDESEARTLVRELQWIEESIPALRASRREQHRVEGTESCWMRSPPTRILCPEYYVGPDMSVFRAGPLGGTRFEFLNHRPADLAALLVQAIAMISKQ